MAKEGDGADSIVAATITDDAPTKAISSQGMESINATATAMTKAKNAIVVVEEACTSSKKPEEPKNPKTQVLIVPLRWMSLGMTRAKQQLVLLLAMRLRTVKTQMMTSKLQEVKAEADEKLKSISGENVLLQINCKALKNENAKLFKGYDDLEAKYTSMKALVKEKIKAAKSQAEAFKIELEATKGTNAESISKVAELLKSPPGFFKKQVKEYTTMVSTHILLVAKYLYPRIELEAIGEGYADGTSEEQALKLINDINGVATSIFNESLDL
uniref:Uncharacterized protein n=1 Tax=Leersia perrieri TaxID=77586 RepID=A0A0D9W327_9ORYZ